MNKSINFPSQTGNFKISCDITVKERTDSYFALSFLNPAGTGLYCYGGSGRLFDKSGNYFGSYRSGVNFNVTAHFFENRSSLFYNGRLCHNNLSQSLPITGLSMDGTLNTMNNSINSKICF